jgi:hypothetical protein
MMVHAPKTCAGCGNTHLRAVATCFNCARKPCIDCGKKTGRGNKSGRCRSCLNAHVNSDPVIAETRRAAIRAKFQDPAHRARAVACAIRNGQKAATNPEHRAWLIEHGREQYRRYLNTPETRAKLDAARPAAARKRSETRMAWCPPELREEYRYWAVSRRKPAAEARAIIEKKIAETNAMRSGQLPFAVDYLRRLAPIGRCDANGKADPVGTHYRYGSSVLTVAEVMQRAKTKGWQPVEYKVAA